MSDSTPRHGGARLSRGLMLGFSRTMPRVQVHLTTADSQQNDRKLHFQLAVVTVVVMLTAIPTGSNCVRALMLMRFGDLLCGVPWRILLYTAYKSDLEAEAGNS